MEKEYTKEVKLYDHVSNSGIVHLPGRQFPAVAIQGDSLSTIFSDAIYFLNKAKEHNDEDMYYAALYLAERIKDHLTQYEKILEREGFEKPYVVDINVVNFEPDFSPS